MSRYGYRQGITCVSDQYPVTYVCEYEDGSPCDGYWQAQDTVIFQCTMDDLHFYHERFPYKDIPGCWRYKPPRTQCWLLLHIVPLYEELINCLYSDIIRIIQGYYVDIPQKRMDFETYGFTQLEKDTFRKLELLLTLKL